jgi:hypothetical protein
MDALQGSILLLFIVGLVLGSYFLPIIVAAARSHPRSALPRPL